MSTIGTDSFTRLWYGNWLWLVALALGIVAMFWILFDSQRTNKKSVLWTVLSIVGLAVVLPSFVLQVAPNIASPGLAKALAYVGAVGGLLALLSLILYLAGVAVTSGLTCPQCGRPMDPSWDECPYCGPEQKTEAVESTEPIPQTESALTGVPVSRPPERTMVISTKSPHLAYVIIKSGTHTGRVFNLLEVTRIGRDPNPTLNDFVIDDPAVSSQHAKIKKEGEQFVIYDLASTNHTYVNGEEILRQPLKTNDTIRMGNTEMVFIEVKDEDSSKVPPARD